MRRRRAALPTVMSISPTRPIDYLDMANREATSRQHSCRSRHLFSEGSDDRSRPRRVFKWTFAVRYPRFSDHSKTLSRPPASETQIETTSLSECFEHLRRVRELDELRKRFVGHGPDMRIRD
jgi:hypothetical protein